MRESGTVFVTGGSGFVGGSVIDALRQRGFGVHALVNRTAIDDEGVRSFPGGLFDDAALDAGLAGCVAAIHLVGIIAERPRAGITFERMHAEATQRVVDAVKRVGIRRYVHMSALGTRPGARSRYHQTKWQAEEYVRTSGLDWTILRPSMIHGPAGEFTQMEAAWARKAKAPWLFMPYFGRGVAGLGGAGKLQPVYVEDVARAFAETIEKETTIGRTYELAGSEVVTWPELHRAFAEAVVGKQRLTAAIPVWYAKLLERALPAALLPFNLDQVLMAEEDNTADIGPFVGDFGWTPRPFRATLGEYAPRLRDVGAG